MTDKKEKRPTKKGLINEIESLNKDLGGIAAVAYSSVWAQRIFICWKKTRKTRGRGLLIGTER